MVPEIAILIVTYNSSRDIEGLLDSLPAALGGLDAEVVVVDNGSSDDTVELLEVRSDCRVIRSANVGYAAGINRGVREAQPAPAILILNPDVRLMPDCVPAMMVALNEPGTGIVAPLVRDGHGDIYRSLRREPTVLRAAGLNWSGRSPFSEYVAIGRDYESSGVVDWALGAVLLVSRDCYDTVGGWDESFFLYSEETEFCLKARELGYSTRFTPDAVATHIGGRSGQSSRLHSMQILNRVRLYRRRHGYLSSLLYYWLSLLSETSHGLRGSKRSWTAVGALLVPSRRPTELGLHVSLLHRERRIAIGMDALVDPEPLPVADPGTTTSRRLMG